jgi:inner membrane protein
MKDTFSRITHSTSFKFVVIGFLSLLLLIPVGQIKSLIMERQERSAMAVLEVSEKWGLDQCVTGPFLTIPLKETRILEGKEEYIRSQLHVLPEELIIDGKVVPEEKKRGIYKTVVYQAAMRIKGHLVLPASLLEQIGEQEIINNTLFLCLGITDLRGIKEVSIQVAGTMMEEMPGLPTTDIAQKGIHIPLSPEMLTLDPIPFQIDLRLDGSSDLSFVPVGKNTELELESNWQNPSFDGAFLPIPSLTGTSSEGFHARWEVNYLNRSYPQHWFNHAANLSDSSFGVHFLIPVDHYQKSMRSVKYALMFIALSFLIFFLTELISGIRLHPIQYFLVGMALVVFYTLLISLAEHLGFDPAYLISSLATVLLISFYVKSSTGRSKQGLMTGSLLLVLYAFLYTTLQLQDFSLLFGSVGIFAVIAVIMFVSRKVNWYREQETQDDEILS